MPFDLAITSAFVESIGDPAPYLRRIAEAGFKHVLWSHHAWSDFVYVEPEVRHIERALRETGLTLVDFHCPTGKEKPWGSPVEYQRLAGIELIKNRIETASRLGCNVVVMHIPAEPPDPAERAGFWDRQRHTIDVLAAHGRRHKVRMALENTLPGNFDTIERFLELEGPDVLGLCYDSGHGAARVDWPGNGLDRLEQLLDRVIDVHLHDNDGTGDQHLMPFEGIVDWPRLARLWLRMSHAKAIIPLEVGLQRTDSRDEEFQRAFLRRAAEVGRKFAAMIENVT